MDLSARLAQLDKESQKANDEARIVRYLTDQLRMSNVSFSVERWNKTMYTSPDVNAIADGYDARHNCGCCPDSPLEIFPFIEVKLPEDFVIPEHMSGQSDHSIRVYSQPACFRPGERNRWGNNDRAFPGWENEFHKHRINEQVIRRVSLLLSTTDEPESTDEE